MSVSNQDNDSKIQEVENHSLDSLSNHKVLIFPRRAPRRQLLKYSISISLATVFLVALFINQIQIALVQREMHILAGERLTDSNRIPANVRPEELNAIIKEQTLASQLSSSSIKIIGSGKLKAMDQFVYGTLEGKYRPVIENGKIKNLQLSGTVSPTDGQVIPNKIDFLLKNREHLSPQFSRVSLLEKGPGFETFELRNQSEQVQGRVRFLVDEVGHITAIDVQDNHNY